MQYLQPGETLTLIVKFGNQTRHKCRACQRYVPGKSDELDINASANVATIERRRSGLA